MKNTCIVTLCIIAALLLVFGLTCISALVFMLLWNWILPLFGVIKLTFWQSWGAIMLLGIVGGCFKNKNSNDVQEKWKNLKEDWNKATKVEEQAEEQVIEKEEVKEEVKEEKVPKVPVTPPSESSEKPKKPSRKRKPKKADKQSASPTL